LDLQLLMAYAISAYHTINVGSRNPTHWPDGLHAALCDKVI
jgi:hypothetical protein